MVLRRGCDYIFFSLGGGGGGGGMMAAMREETQDFGREKCIALLPFLSFFISEDIRMGFDCRSFFEYEALLQPSFSRAFFVT